MKLTKKSIDDLYSLVLTALVANIKKLIIEPGKIRGIDEKQSVVVITDQRVPDLGGTAGINRLELLAARLNLIKNQGDLDVEVTMAPNGTDVSMMELSSGKVKTQFRCASVESVKGVPKTSVDTLVWDIKLGTKELLAIAQGAGAMGAETITIASKDGVTVSIECIDANKDVFSIDLAASATWIGTDAPGSSFCQKFAVKTVVPLIKEGVKVQDPMPLYIGAGGILSFKVNDFDFSVIPTN